jgi:single-stranded DNA-binding protein
MANNNVKVGTVTVCGKVFQAPELRENTKGNKFATFKVAKNNGKDKEGNWLPSTFFSVLLPHFLATKKETGEPSWLVNNLTKGTFVVLTGELEVGAWKDKTGEAQPQLSLIPRSYNDVVLGGAGEAASTAGTVAGDDAEETPF